MSSVSGHPCSGAPFRARPFHRAVTCGAGLACLVLASSASRAAPWSLHAEGSVSGAWSDNLFNAPELADQGQNIPEAGFYTQLRPSTLFTFESPRTVHVASYVLDLSLYASGEEGNAPPNTTNHTLAYNGLFVTSPATELNLGTTLNFGTISSALTAGGAGAGLPDATLPGGSQFRSYGLSEAFRWQAAQDWRLSQGASVSRVDTDLFEVQGGVQTASANNHSNNFALTLGADRSWPRTALGINGSVSYLTTEQNPLAGAAITDTRQIASSASVSIRRDISPRWAGAASAGLALLTVLESPMAEAQGTGNPTPTFNLSVNYFRPVGSVTAALGLSVNKTIESNLFLGMSTDTTGGTLNGSIPLPWFRRGGQTTVQLSGSVGMSHSKPFIDEPPTWNGYNADLAASWAFRESFDVTIRYQYVDTDVDLNGAPVPRTDGFQPPVDFYRNTILVQLSGRFPDRQAAALPSRVPLRVDRANESPIGGDQPGSDQSRSGRSRRSE